ncbi:hypothetical protein [Streptomyces sp. ST2-7A]|uniref:hypothetical protein n=1 Tax=Streptomyces sp. ST2-7A TaxID=2907214 RepID=UPI001F1E72B4|nr:hypothetical protein [Streptomyces sp. ST2-7A]MCE7081459.1 hypothetical protein [Streptomyces sp. ST2-7A]
MTTERGNDEMGTTNATGGTGTANGTGWFTELAEELRRRGMAERRVGETVTELSDHLLDSGADPADEFGPAADLAARLAGDGTGPTDGDALPESADDAGAREWRFVCDQYVDRDVLNRQGDLGWEVVRIDALGRFVCRRDPAEPLRWEYRREVVRRRERGEHAAELAPDGWEPCGYWLYMAYYKRPLSAATGTAGALEPGDAEPGRPWYFGRRVRVMYLACGVVLLCTVPGVFLNGGPDTATWIGAAVGGVIGGGVGWWAMRRDIVRGVRDDI